MERAGWGSVCLAVLVLLAAAPPAQAGAWRVTKLASSDSSGAAHSVRVETAPDCDLPFSSLELRLDDALPDLSCLKVGADIYLELRSEQNVRVVHDYGGRARLQLKQSSPQRNALVVWAGEWLVSVATPLRVVSVQAGKRAEGLTHGTVFRVALDEASGNARFRVDEGRIEVNAATAIQVGEGPRLLSEQRRMLAAGEPELVLPPISADGYVQKYGSYRDAIAVFEQRAQQAAERQDDDARFNALVALGDVLAAAGRGADAAARYEQAAALAQGDRDAYWRAMLQGAAGTALRTQNRFGEAAAAYRRSIAAHALVPFAEGMDPVTDERGNLAMVAFDDGTYRCAAQSAAEVLKALDARAGTRSSTTRIGMLQTQAGIELTRGKLNAAIALYDQAFDLAKRYRSLSADAPPDSATAAMIAARLGKAGALLAAGRGAEADGLYRLAERNALALLPGPSVAQAAALLGQAQVIAARGRPAEALAATDRIIELLGQAPFDALMLGDVQQSRGDWLLALKRRGEALAAWRQARTLWEQVWPDDSHPRFALLLPALAKALRAERDETQAREAERAAAAGARALAERDDACLR